MEWLREREREDGDECAKDGEVVYGEERVSS